MTSTQIFLSLFLLLLLSVGCSKPVTQHHLEGTWNLDVGRQMADPMYKIPSEAPPEVRKKAEDELRAKMGDRSMTFTADKVTLKSGSKTDEGTYKVASQNGNTWSLEMTVDDKPQTCSIEWTDDDHLVLAIGGTPARMYLARAH